MVLHLLTLKMLFIFLNPLSELLGEDQWTLLSTECGRWFFPLTPRLIEGYIAMALLMSLSPAIAGKGSRSRDEGVLHTPHQVPVFHLTEWCNFCNFISLKYR